MLTVFETARVYHIGRNRIYNAIQTGELKAYRPNSKSYILKESDIEAWIESHIYSPCVGRRRKNDEPME